MAPVVLELQRRPGIEHYLAVTGQHRSMLDQMLALFGLEPDFDLDIMRDRQTLTHVTTLILERLGGVLEEISPDVVLVHGDTTTSFAAALAAYYARVSVGHVEAGLRTGDRYNPYPEEMNRHLIDILCDVHFAPTQAARDTLAAENLPDAVYVTGNTVIDALLSVVRRPEPEGLIPEVPADAPVVLVEAHRRENWGQPMREICIGIRQLAEVTDGLHVVFPVHLNPSVRDTVFELLGGMPRVHLLDPQDYLPFVFLMKRARFILTDSGGIQEEAPSLGTPVLVLRTKTERPEAVAAGTAILVGPDREKIFETGTKLMTDEAFYNRMSTAANPYGDGRAAERVADGLQHHFGLSDERPDEFQAGD